MMSSVMFTSENVSLRCPFHMIPIVTKKDHLGRTILHDIIIERLPVNLVQFLIDYGADINAKDKYGWTPLHYAVLYERYDAARFFLDKGADPNVEEINGRTPLYCAAERDNVGMLSLLLNKGANFRVIDCYGYNVLTYSTIHNKERSRKYLLSRCYSME